jgi:predicted small lipoprotein YifL
MKQLKQILAATILAGALAACGSKPAETPAEAPAETPAEAPAETAEAAAAATAEDGQNPVMNVVGDYQADRCSVHVEAQDKDGALITVHWGGSATESSEWTMSGTFDAEKLTVYYQDGVKKNVVYDADGKVTSEEEVYVGGHGTFTFNVENNTLTWEEDQEKIADGMVFEFVPVVQ